MSMLVFPTLHHIILPKPKVRNGDSQAGRAGADHRHLFPVGFRFFNFHSIQIHIGDIILNAGKMDGGVFLSPNAMTGTLLLVIAHNAANGGQRIVSEQDIARFHQFILLKQADHLGDWRVHRAKLLTHGLFTV